MNFEKEMYEVKEKWEESYFSDEDRERIRSIVDLIPPNTTSLLDVGCGNGMLVNSLVEDEKKKIDRIVGTDRSTAALSFVKTEKVKSEITNLPFTDNEFDVVTCLEVIEHLPQKVYEKALQELDRVSKNWLIISVPYDEDLNYSSVTCPQCITSFNPFYHMRSFNKEKLNNLYPEDIVKCISLDSNGSYKIPYFKHFKKWISKKLHPDQFPSSCICPMCGYQEFEKLKKQKAQTLKGNNKQGGLSKYWPHRKKPKWIVGVYKKLHLTT